jgi:hypothetical protein
MAAVLAGLFTVLSIFFMIGGAMPFARLALMPFVVACFFAFAWCFCAVVCFPLSLCLAMRGRRRSVYVDGRRLIVKEAGRKQVELDLEGAVWTVGNWACDNYGAYPPGQRLVIVGNGKRWYACGFSDEKREQWERFLTDAGVRRLIVGWRRMLPMVLAGGVAGGAVGGCVGQIASLFGGPAMLVAAIGFMGFLDGVVATLFYFALLNRTMEKMPRGAMIALLAATYAAIGVKGGAAGGLMGLVIVPLSNAACGAIVGWYVCDLALRRRLS